jgi:uncharacterized protein YkwD
MNAARRHEASASVRRLAFFLLLLALLQAGCGGGRRESAPATPPRVGDAVVASNDVSHSGVKFAGPRAAAGHVTGRPVFGSLKLAPPVGLGSTQASCAGTNLVPNADNVSAVRRATLCLLNAERKARGLVALRLNSQLALAAIRHSRDMVNNKYFAHTSPSGVTFVRRIRKAGYMNGYTSWTIGENLAWGGGTYATPAAIVRAWMQSPEHKANILNGRYRQAGFGIVIGLPVRGSSSGATYSNEFGKRA